MYLDVRFIGRIEEDLPKVRERLVHHIMVLERFSEGRRYRNVEIYVYNGDLPMDIRST